MGFEPTTFSLARRRSTTELHPHGDPTTDRQCRDPESNWGHRDFQSRALPTELSRPYDSTECRTPHNFTLGHPNRQVSETRSQLQPRRPPRSPGCQRIAGRPAEEQHTGYRPRSPDRVAHSERALFPKRGSHPPGKKPDPRPNPACIRAIRLDLLKEKPHPAGLSAGLSAASTGQRLEGRRTVKPDWTAPATGQEYQGIEKWLPVLPEREYHLEERGSSAGRQRKTRPHSAAQAASAKILQNRALERKDRSTIRIPRFRGSRGSRLALSGSILPALSTEIQAGAGWYSPPAVPGDKHP